MHILFHFDRAALRAIMCGGAAHSLNIIPEYTACAHGLVWVYFSPIGSLQTSYLY